MDTRELLIEFGTFLRQRQLSIDVTVAGGAALNLLEITDRTTRDVDVVEPQQIPAPIQIAAFEFAEDPRRGLEAGWLNTAARVYADPLPKGWAERAGVAFESGGLTVRVLERADLLKLKTYALCKRGKDLEDCVALNPSAEELQETRKWLSSLNRGPDWPKDLAVGLKLLTRALEKGERARGHDDAYEPDKE